MMPKYNEGKAILIWVKGVGNRHRILVREKEAREFLLELCRVINMTPIYPPISVRFEGEVAEDSGISAVLIIAESHLALHTFPEQAGGSFQLTVVSCKGFDSKALWEAVRKTFNISKEQANVVVLGDGMFFYE